MWGGARRGLGREPRRRAAGAARRLWRNRSTTFLIAASVVLTLVPVVWILVQILIKGGSAMSWEFLTKSTAVQHDERGRRLPERPDRHRDHGRAGERRVRSRLGILAAVYLVEYGKGNWLAKLIRFFSDVMTGVPSHLRGRVRLHGPRDQVRVRSHHGSRRSRPHHDAHHRALERGDAQAGAAGVEGRQLRPRRAPSGRPSPRSCCPRPRRASPPGPCWRSPGRPARPRRSS